MSENRQAGILSEEEVRDWLEALMHSAVVIRFMVTIVTSDNPMMQNLLDKIKKSAENILECLDITRQQKETLTILRCPKCGQRFELPLAYSRGDEP
jgi:Zn finger protein HypA/HybF involved in hydrogenase expression